MGRRGEGLRRGGEVGWSGKRKVTVGRGSDDNDEKSGYALF